jgi:hypothetical protein
MPRLTPSDLAQRRWDNTSGRIAQHKCGAFVFLARRRQKMRNAC